MGISEIFEIPIRQCKFFGLRCSFPNLYIIIGQLYMLYSGINHKIMKPDMFD